MGGQGVSKNVFMNLAISAASAMSAQVCPAAEQAYPVDGDRILLLRPKWAGQLLQGSKTIEVRPCRLESGGTWLGCQGRLVGWAFLSNSRQCHNLDDFRATEALHGVSATALPYIKTWLTDITDVWELPEPIQFKRVPGPVTWSKFTPVAASSTVMTAPEGPLSPLRKKPRKTPSREAQSAADKEQKKTTSKKSMTSNLKSVLADAVLAGSASLEVLQHPRAFTIGSACSGWCSELFACRSLGLPFVPVFGCDICRHCKTVCENTWSHALWYDNCCSDNFLQSPYVDVFVAGFPCQPFSRSGKNEGQADSQGRGGIIWFLRDWIAAHLPRIFILENVRNLLETHYEFLAEVLSALEGIQRNGAGAYYISWQLLNARTFGTPQNRERLFICGLRKDSGVSRMVWPKPVGEASIFDYVDPRPEGLAAFPGRLPSARTEKQNLLLVLNKLKAAGKDPLKEPFVIDINGTDPHYNKGYSPCITRVRGGSGGHWLSWKQRKMTSNVMLALMDIDPREIKTDAVSPRQLGLMAGNAIPIKMFSSVLLQALMCANMC